MCVGMCTICMPGASGGQKAPACLKLEFWVAVSHRWVIGIRCGPSQEQVLLTTKPFLRLSSSQSNSPPLFTLLHRLPVREVLITLSALLLLACCSCTTKGHVSWIYTHPFIIAAALQVRRLDGVFSQGQNQGFGQTVLIQRPSRKNLLPCSLRICFLVAVWLGFLLSCYISTRNCSHIPGMLYSVISSGTRPSTYHVFLQGQQDKLSKLLRNLKQVNQSNRDVIHYILSQASY